MILVRKPNEYLLKLDSTKSNHDMINTIITNPLSAIAYPAFCKELVQLLDHPISVKSMKQAVDAGYPITQSPITRCPVIGGLCLSPSEDHCAATNAVISAVTSNGKKVGHPDLWFMLIWYLIEDGKVPHLTDLLPQIREHMTFRLKNHIGTFTLTNIPSIPVTHVPLGIACWCTLYAASYGIPEELLQAILTTTGAT